MKNTMPVASEHTIQRAIQDWLTYLGWFVWRNNSGIIRTQTNSFVKLGLAGLPDLFALKNGVLLGVEVKRPGKKPTELQDQMLETLRAHGAKTLIATSVDDIDKFLKGEKI